QFFGIGAIETIEEIDGQFFFALPGCGFELPKQVVQIGAVELAEDLIRVRAAAEEAADVFGDLFHEDGSELVENALLDQDLAQRAALLLGQIAEKPVDHPLRSLVILPSAGFDLLHQCADIRRRFTAELLDNSFAAPGSGDTAQSVDDGIDSLLNGLGVGAGRVAVLSRNAGDGVSMLDSVGKLMSEERPAGVRIRLIAVLREEDVAAGRECLGI